MGYNDDNRNDDFKFDPVPFMVGAHIGYRHEYKKQQRRMREQARREGYDYDDHDGGSSSGGGIFAIIFAIVWFIILCQITQAIMY